MHSEDKNVGTLPRTGEAEGRKKLRLHCQLLSADGGLETRRSYSIRRRRSRSLQLSRRASADAAAPAGLNGDAALRHSLRASLQPGVAEPTLAAEGAHKQGGGGASPTATDNNAARAPAAPAWQAWMHKATTEAGHLWRTKPSSKAVLFVTLLLAALALAELAAQAWWVCALGALCWGAAFAWAVADSPPAPVAAPDQAPGELKPHTSSPFEHSAWSPRSRLTACAWLWLFLCKTLGVKSCHVM